MAQRKNAAGQGDSKLALYRRKRDFNVTAEPPGDRTGDGTGDKPGDKGAVQGRRGVAAGGLYVVQLHDATRLHYDFRLELDGVLKSWAVTRGPSLDPADRRLAVQVEDHPRDYGGFEGIIPEGQYGGGTVIIWDRGRWQPDGDPHAGLRQGKLDFHLDGERLKGAFHLVRFAAKEARRPGATAKRQNWLLIKGDDAYARPGDGDAAMREATSIVSGRDLEAVAANAPAVWQSGRAEPLRQKPAGKNAAKKASAKKTGPKAAGKTAAGKKAAGKKAAAKKTGVKKAVTKRTVGRAAGATKRAAAKKTTKKAVKKKAVTRKTTTKAAERG